MVVFEQIVISVVAVYRQEADSRDFDTIVSETGSRGRGHGELFEC